MNKKPTFVRDPKVTPEMWAEDVYGTKFDPSENPNPTLAQDLYNDKPVLKGKIEEKQKWR